MTSAAHAGPVLVIEDDRKTAALVALYLEREGFEPLTAHDGQTGLMLARRHRPILVILDLMLPGLDGWEVCRRLRRDRDVPIIMLTARGDEIDRVSGLTLGADDYVVKPFSPRELVARVNTVLRRTMGQPLAPEGLLIINELVLDPYKRTVTLAGQPISLTAHEYALLNALMGAPGKIFTRDELIVTLYPRGEATVIDRVIDVHIGKLRHKIETDPAAPRYILTVRGMGYQLAEKPPKPGNLGQCGAT